MNRRAFRRNPHRAPPLPPSEFISVAVQSVLAALRDGAVLVAVILVLFLANLPATFIR